MLSRRSRESKEYSHVQGDYWLLEDSFSAASSEEFNLEVKKMPSKFRIEHMEITKYLFEEHYRQLSVEEVFPRYTRKLIDSKLMLYSDQIAFVEDEIKDLQS